MINTLLRVLFLMIPVCIVSWISKPTGEAALLKFRVTGCIMETVNYCGGANPPKEILEKARTPAPIPFGKLFIKKVMANEEGAKIIDSVKADANGAFSISLPAGTYCLVEEWKGRSFVLPHNNEKQKIDSVCYRKLYAACDYQLTITDKNIAGIKIIFNRPCLWNRPCITYNGALPPMAPRH